MLEEACATVDLKKANAELRCDQLQSDITALEVRLSQNSQKLRDLDNLRALGFQLAEFRMLRDIITEVGEERGIIGNEAVKDFFEDLRKYYYDYLREMVILAFQFVSMSSNNTYWSHEDAKRDYYRRVNSELQK